MSTVATLWVKLGLDSKGYADGLSKAADKTMKAGATMMKVGAAATAGLTLPIIGAGVAATKMAIDLQESQNAANVVFGEAIGIMDDYGKTVATTAGLSRAEFNQLGAVTGAFLKNVGFDTEQAAEETIKLTERASDMASIFNTDVSQALNAIQSGLKGEFNPLEQFGVKLNAAAIEARALSMGLADAEGNISDSAKATAALALVMEQTDQFAGDFVNTSDGLANSMKIAKAQFTDAAAALGTQLLPIGLKIVEFLSGLIEKFNALNPEQQKTILIVLGIVAAIGPLVSIIGALVSVWGALSGAVVAVAGAIGIGVAPLLLIIGAVIAIIALLKLAWDNNFGGIQEKTAAFIAWLKPIWDKLWEGILFVFNYVWSQIKTIWEALQAAFSGDWTTFGEKLREVWDRAWNFIKDVIATAWPVIKGLVKTLINNVLTFFATTDWGEVGKNIVRGIGNGLLSMIGWIRDKAAAVAGAALAAAKGFLGIQSPSKAFGELGKFSAMGFGMQFEKSMAGFQPQMALAMSVPAASVSTPSGAGSQGGGQDLDVIYRMLRNLPEDLKRGNRDLIEKLGRR